tara:strand:+ start:156 stop:797 length:642 start_codon:yes stop_codon:yes gene_type:complete
MTAKIKLNAASGGGSVSLKAPSTTTSNAAVELQLPVEDGSADTFLKTNGSGTLSFAAAGGGKVLQVVNALTSSATTITSNSFTDTGVTDSITTSAANSTILVLGSMAYDTARDSHFSGARIRLVRTISGSDSAFMESTSDKNVGQYDGDSSAHNRIYGQYPLNFHDSGLSSIAAGTTITYKVQGRVENTGGNDDLRINNGAKFSTIILVEIGA